MSAAADLLNDVLPHWVKDEDMKHELRHLTNFQKTRGQRWTGGQGVGSRGVRGEGYCNYVARWPDDRPQGQV